MRTATENDLIRLAGQFEAAALVLRSAPNCACPRACKSKAAHAAKVAREAAGFTGVSGGAGRSGDVANPTLNAVIGWHGGLKRHVGPEWWQEGISRDVALASGAVSDLILLVSELGMVTSTDPVELTKNGQGTCPACDRFCSGAVNDRLVSGLCDTDYRAWKRAGCPERFGFINQRRVESHRCKHPTTRWLGGVTSCVLCGEELAS